MSRPIAARALTSSATFALCGILLSACTGVIVDDPGTAPEPGQNAAGGAGVGGPSTMPKANIDPGRVAIHRLNNTEYDNTVRDLLGTTAEPAKDLNFLAEEGFGAFDNTATALGMTGPQYSKYFEAATSLMTAALADDTQRQSFMSCTPAAANDPCARQIIESFGMRIYRRPLEAGEVTRAMKVYDADFARAQNGSEAIALALRAMLSAANFLYRIEHDDAPTSLTPHALSAYELASRLSYFQWSTMPDATLFASAETGELLDPTKLDAVVDRMLADPKAGAFVDSFAGQWLQLRKLLTHSVTAQVFPTFSVTLADAMLAEGKLWFQDFLTHERPVTEWFTADFNYVNDELASNYGMTVPSTGDQLVKVEITSDQRKGFLGLSSFLTLTSVPSRTSPTGRGAWLLGQLLCSPPDPPPPGVPALDKSAEPGDTVPTGSENVRERLERHRTDPVCGSCHRVIDPLGLGLERYDGIGRYREVYGNGDAIVPEGVLADGTKFSGAEELGVLLGKDPRFTECLATKMYTYALGREVEKFDKPSIQELNEQWAARGLTLNGLMKTVVVSDAFRFRRGESQ